MNDVPYEWKEHVRHTCVCGHKELNRDISENKFIRLNEDVHKTTQYDGIEGYAQLVCPKCGTMKAERCF